MYKFFSLLLLSTMMFAQIGDDEGGDDTEVVDISSIDCTLEANPNLFEELKYSESDITLRVKMWYSEGYQYYKKWKSEKEAEKIKTYSEQMERNFWKLVLNDPTGNVKTKMKSRGEVARTVLAMEKLADMYIDDNNIDMLKEIVVRGLENFPNERKIQQYAATYFMAQDNNGCAVKHFEKWYELYPEDEKENRVKILGTIVSLYVKLGQKELAMSTCDRILSIDPSLSEYEEMKIQILGDPEKAFDLKYKQWQANQSDMKLLYDAARLARSIDKLEIANTLYKKLYDHDPNKVEYQEVLTFINFEFQNYSSVIKYGKNLNDTRSLEKVIQSYVALGQYQNAYNVAAKIQNTNSADGHYLKGFVYEKTATAAQSDAEFSKKPFEWRLLYRLAYIEYNMGGGSGKDRARRILQLIPNKGDIFLKSKRIKPETGKYSNWITW